MSETLERRCARGLQGLTLGALFLAGLFPGNNPDTFGHLAQGRQIAELGHVPLFDTWSLLPGPPRPWHNYEWLSDLLFYGLYRSLGYDGLLLFKCLLLCLTGHALLTFARRLGGDRALMLSALVVISTIPVTRIRFSDRPHVLGLCLAAFYFVILSRLVDSSPDERRLRRNLVASIFTLHVLWVNLHGSHLLGLAITLAFCALSPRTARRPLLAALALEALASCISPYGPYIMLDAIEHVLNPRYRGLVTEWMPWTEDDPPWLQLGPALQAALLTVVAPRLVRLSASARAGLLVALLLGLASFRSIRFVAEFMLLTAPLVGSGYARIVESWGSRTFVTRVLLVCTGLGVVVPWGASTLPPYAAIGHGISYAERPHGPGMLLNRMGAQARVLGSIGTSWYLMWEAPRARYVIDGRVPFYGPDFVTHVVQAFQDPRALDALLRQHDVNAIVLEHVVARDRQLIQHLQEKPAWSLALVDDAFAFYVRQDAYQTQRLPQFHHLQPTFGSDWILAAREDERTSIAGELAQLDRFSTARGYRLWGAALLELAPFRLPGRAVGFRWPETAQESKRYERASRYMADAERYVGEIPIVASTQALVAAIRCDSSTVERALGRLEVSAAPGREAVLARQELALRQGRADEVLSFIDAAQQLPEGRDDPWIAQVRRRIFYASDVRRSSPIVPSPLARQVTCTLAPLETSSPPRHLAEVPW